MAFCERCGRSARPSLNNATARELEDEILQIEALMELLSQRRTVLRRKINKLAPISRLPQEIILETFSLVTQVEPAEPGLGAVLSSSELSTSKPILPSPLSLGSICVAWRNLAWNTPLLWRNVNINVSFARHSSHVQLLSEWLLRARNIPLHIKLSTFDEDEDVFYAMRAILEVLLSRSVYWGMIDCLLPSQCHEILLGHRFPMLVSACFRPPKGTISTFSRPPDIFLATPLLTEVDLSGYDFSSMVLPWHQLRKFRTQFLTVAECLKVLERSPNLDHCHFDNVYCPDNVGLPSENILSPSYLVHPALQVLEVTFVKGSAVSLLDAVSLPSLRELSKNCLGTEPISYPPIISLTSRSFNPVCHLQKLSISQSTLAEEDLIECLEALPGLVELAIYVKELTLLSGSIFAVPTRYGLSRRLLGRMYPTSATCSSDQGSIEPILPNLTCLTYEGRLLCLMVDLVDMLCWRVDCEGIRDVAVYDHVVLLKRAEITIREGNSRGAEADEGRIQRLEKHGVAVRHGGSRNHRSLCGLHHQHSQY